MRICVNGKYPPIEGGVCMQNFWAAHGLAKRGHEVHVVTNANEVGPFHRMHMRQQDWDRCSAVYGAGSVTVHWTEADNPSMFHIPTGNPYIAKLTTIIADLHERQPLDVILSYYLEPYVMAGHIAAEIAGLPHVVRMAGSDAGRLWHHPQLARAYDHILRSARFVITGGAVAERAVTRGIKPEAIAALHGYPAPEDLFSPEGPTLDLAALRQEVAENPDPAFRDRLWGDFSGTGAYFGVSGKLGDCKGTITLLKALQQLKRSGIEVGLVALAHGEYEHTELEFRRIATELDIVDRILQIPFVPHWRVAEFLRGCLAVCCLEQGFPITFHTPTVALETLLSGSCLVGSTELIRKLPHFERLPHGYGCIAVEDVDDFQVVAKHLATIAADPKPAALVGARGRDYAREIVKSSRYTENLEGILKAAVANEPLPAAARVIREARPQPPARERFRLARMAVDALARAQHPVGVKDGALAHQSLQTIAAALESAIRAGRTELTPLLPGIQLELAISQADDTGSAAASASGATDPLFRLAIARWALTQEELAKLVPVKPTGMQLVSFAYDITPYRSARSLSDLPPSAPPGRSHLVLFGTSTEIRDPVQVDGLTARILELSTGSRSADAIAKQLEQENPQWPASKTLQWIEQLFVAQLVGLENGTTVPA